jgi:hypothetical protein
MSTVYPLFDYDLSPYLVKPLTEETSVKIWRWADDSEFRCFLSEDSCDVSEELPDLAAQFDFDPWNCIKFENHGIEVWRSKDSDGDPIETIEIEKSAFVKFFEDYPELQEC